MMKILFGMILVPLCFAAQTESISNEELIPPPLVSEVVVEEKTVPQTRGLVAYQENLMPPVRMLTSSTIHDDFLYFDEWERDQKAKVGLKKSDCIGYGGCHGDEERWLNHLPTLGELIKEYFEPEDREFITWLAYCESSAVLTDIYSDAVNSSSQATGWFQHLPKFWVERSYRAGFLGFAIDHPVANVGVASWLYYDYGGAKHWRVCTDRYIREIVYGNGVAGYTGR